MSRKAVVTVSAAVLTIAAFIAAGALPGNLPGAFTFVSRADVERVQQSIGEGKTPNDAPVRMVNIAGRFNLGVYTLNSPKSDPPKPGAPIMGFYHNDIAEIYYIVSGNGYWRVGGELENPKADDVTQHAVKEVRGPGVTGVLKGFTNQKISAGDVLVVPPGVPHSPGQMLENTKIVRIVLDPHHVLQLVPPTGELLKATPAASKLVGSLPGTYTFIAKADIDRVLKEEETPGPSGDRSVRTVDLPAMGYRLGVYVLHGTKEQDKAPTTGWYHTHIAEVYTFMRGTGTFMIGGTLENPTEDDANNYSTKVVRGPSVSGTFQGVTEQAMRPGDWLIAPIGVPHTPGKVTGVPRDILRIAVDPDKVLPLK